MQDHNENHHNRKRTTHPEESPQQPQKKLKEHHSRSNSDMKDDSHQSRQQYDERKHHSHNSSDRHPGNNHHQSFEPRRTHSEFGNSKHESQKENHENRNVSNQPKQLDIKSIAYYENLFRIGNSVPNSHHQPRTNQHNSYVSFSAQFQTQQHDHNLPKLHNQTFIPKTEAQFATISDVELREKFKKVDMWQGKFFNGSQEKLLGSQDQLLNSTEKFSLSGLNYSFRIQQQYHQYYELLVSELSHTKFNYDARFSFKRGSFRYYEDLVEIEGLGFFPDPFLINKTKAILPNIMAEFYTQLRLAIQEHNKVYENNKIVLPERIHKDSKIVSSEKAKKEDEKKSPAETLADMNIGFKVLDCVENNIITRIIVVSPSGFGTSQQCVIWNLIKNVLSNMNLLLQHNNNIPMTMVLQTSFNNDRDKPQHDDMIYKAIFEEESTSYSSYFDELIQSLRNAIHKKFRDYNNLPIDPKPCSEKKIAQFETKLKAIFDEVKPIEMESTILGESYHSQSYITRMPCSECMKAAPVYHLMSKVSPRQLTSDLKPTESKQEKLEEKFNSRITENAKNSVQGEINRCDITIANLQEHLKFAQQGFATQTTITKKIMPGNKLTVEEQTKLISRITDTISRQQEKRKTLETKLTGLQNQLDGNEQEQQAMSQFYCCMYSPYRDQFVTSQHTKEPEIKKLREIEEAYYSEHKKP